jgi:uncharacterized membrane protein
MQQKISRVLIAHSITNVILLVCKMLYTNSYSGLYFVWNLFLAAIPFVISLYMCNQPQKINITTSLLLIAWLLFLPNAPYIITDYVHLNPSTTHLYWFSLILFFSFALNGLLYGIFSILFLRQHFFERLSPLHSSVMLAAISLLCGYGVYIGRFLRWNSWSVITKPLALLQECAQYLFHPSLALHTWAFLLVFAVLVFFPVLVLEMLVGRGLRSDTAVKF